MNDKAAEPFLKKCQQINNKYPLLRYHLAPKEAIDYINMTHYYNENKDN
jgi:hypothetical protein